MIKPRSEKMRLPSVQPTYRTPTCQTEKCKSLVGGFSTLQAGKQVRIEDTLCPSCRSTKPNTFWQERRGSKEAFEESEAYRFLLEFAASLSQEVSEEQYNKVLVAWRASL